MPLLHRTTAEVQSFHSLMPLLHRTTAEVPTLIQIVTAALASATLRSGPHLVCRPGCTQCCHGVFAISQQDAARLREGLDALTQTDPARATRIQQRLAESLARLTPHFPGDAATGLLAPDHEDNPAFDSFANDEPCPVLDPATGTCDLYAHRPILCRTFGPPARTLDGDLAHCELCYTTVTPAEIAACELDPTLPDTIAASDDTFNAAHHLHGETLIAFALRPHAVPDAPAGRTPSPSASAEQTVSR